MTRRVKVLLAILVLLFPLWAGVIHYGHVKDAELRQKMEQLFTPTHLEARPFHPPHLLCDWKGQNCQKWA